MSVKLSVVIHAEEEFDWDSGFDRKNIAITHQEPLICLIQSIVDSGAKVTLAMDYPFVVSKGGGEVIDFCNKYYKEEVEFAAHLHPWVTPPFIEPEQDGIVDAFHSYPGNLEPSVEFSKLETLTNAIHKRSGYRPVTYLAGRYGVGRNTKDALLKLGYKIDLSLSAFSNFSEQFGPDFSSVDNKIFHRNGLTYIPHSCCLYSTIPLMTAMVRNNVNLFTKKTKLSLILRKILRVKHYRLSPEGVSLRDLKAAVKHLISRGENYLLFSLHSPSVKEGMTPYVRNKEEEDRFNRVMLDFIQWYKAMPDSTFFLPSNVTFDSNSEGV